MEDAQRRSLIHRLPAAGIALPFLLAVAAQVVGPRPRPIAAAPGRPALAFDQYLVDRGEVSPSQEVRAHFEFTNRGRALVRVAQLVPSCGCLQPRLDKNIYQPGESGKFDLHVQTANQKAGFKEYTIAVKYTDPEPREAIVTLRMVLPENQVFVNPPALSFIMLSDLPAPAGVLPQTFEVTDRRGEGRHLNITSVECVPRVADVDLEETYVDEEGHWHGRLKVTIPGQLPSQPVQALIRIATDDPEYPRLRVPLQLQGGSLRKILDRNIQPAAGTR
jgi:uncharacterized protein DUF1573